MKRRTKSRSSTGFRLDGPNPTPPPKRATSKKRLRSATRGDWWKLREAHLRVFPECRICGLVAPNNNVHHMVYRGARGLSEKPGDLVTLCREHHDEFHAIYGRASEIRGSIIDKTLAFIEAKRRLPF